MLIDGRSGSGKTSLAEALRIRIGASIVHVEHFYPGWRGLRAGAEWLVDEVLVPWRRREAVRLREWDWHRDRFVDGGVLAPGGDLVVEGCGAISRASRPLADAAVWLEGEEALRRDRARARDGDDDWWAGWRAQEDEFYAVEGSAALADHVLGSDAGADEVLALLRGALGGDQRE